MPKPVPAQAGGTQSKAQVALSKPAKNAQFRSKAHRKRQISYQFRSIMRNFTLIFAAPGGFDRSRPQFFSCYQRLALKIWNIFFHFSLIFFIFLTEPPKV